jgi:hypothetical protein
LNDDFDSILFGDALSYHRRIVDYLCNDKDKFIFFSLKKNGMPLWESKSLFEGIPFEEILSCFDENDFSFAEGRVLAFLKHYFNDELSQKNALSEINTLVKESISLPCAESFALETYRYNRDLCSRLHVFSMSDSYDLDNMWGYYADSGRGFCIEYDFMRGKELSIGLKKFLLNIYRVNYSNECSFFDIESFWEKFFFENDPEECLTKIMESTINQITSKSKCWEHEREWRFVVGGCDSKIYADIVSGIIIDERSILTENAKKLINLCKSNDWEIKVRMRSLIDGEHIYLPYEKYSQNKDVLDD